MIELNDGTAVPVACLLHFMARHQLTAMPIAQRHVAIWDHPEQESLDFFFRLFSDNMDTAQATEVVVDQLYGSGYFEPCEVQSQVTGRNVRGIRITML